MSMHSIEEYLNCDPFGGDSPDIRCHKVKVVKVRRSHKCISPDGGVHDIEVGEFARRETALADGEWSTCYTCLPCMDKWLDETG